MGAQESVELSPRYVASAQLKPTRPSPGPRRATVSRDLGEPCCCSVGNINSVTHPHLHLEEEQGAEGAAN